MEIVWQLKKQTISNRFLIEDNLPQESLLKLMQE